MYIYICIVKFASDAQASAREHKEADSQNRSKSFRSSPTLKLNYSDGDSDVKQM